MIFFTSENGAHADEFLDMVAGIQGSRMNDQRADFNFPGLNNSTEVIGRIRSRQEQANLDDYDNFFDMLMKCQVWIVLYMLIYLLLAIMESMLILVIMDQFIERYTYKLQ